MLLFLILTSVLCNISLLGQHNQVIKLNSESYERVTSYPRNHTVVVVLTALGEQFKCAPCTLFESVLTRVATNNIHNHLFFAQLDFPDGQETFNKLKLQTAPYLLLFTPSSKDPAVYDFNSKGVAVAPFLLFIKQRTHLQISLPTPIDYSRLAFLVVSLSVILLLIFAFYPIIKLFLENKRLWSIAATATIILYTTGHMWNHIRGAAYSGNSIFLVGDFSSQNIAETQVVGLLYGLFSVFCVFLVTVVPTVDDVNMQRMVAGAAVSGFFGLYCVLLMVFKWKNGGYPFNFF